MFRKSLDLEKEGRTLKLNAFFFLSNVNQDSNQYFVKNEYISGSSNTHGSSLIGYVQIPFFGKTRNEETLI